MKIFGLQTDPYRGKRIVRQRRYQLSLQGSDKAESNVLVLDFKTNNKPKISPPPHDQKQQLTLSQSVSPLWPLAPFCSLRFSHSFTINKKIAQQTISLSTTSRGSR